MVPSPFGTLGIIWRAPAEHPKILRVVLPREAEDAQDRIRSAHPAIRLQACPGLRGLDRDLETFFRGIPVAFRLDTLVFDQCGRFQQQVIEAEHRIPRGLVATYGGIARHLGVPGAGRAVGRALATNPFPIIVPCHRAIRSDGSLGGFQGGLAMKRALLEMEGIRFSEDGKVLIEEPYY